MKRRHHHPLLAGMALAGALLAGAAQSYTLEEFTFEDPNQFEDFRDLIGELRCLVCQNESLAGSQAGVAQDLREEVYAMMREGQSREEVVDFLVARYGDFVLYDPPIKPSTYILWFGPFVLVGGAGLLLWRAIRRKKAEPEQDLTADERARLQQLIASRDDEQRD
ncbi:cytochrome C biogenesis protein [Marichromatium purpuratum 984]|uniref:Cytochrome c-type biogenesis protein n=1 Tax=Marichromatium purpuratum 984 TaxID=765910 RepID=W0DY78_MARPU|nr:cytochrome c-type biogenesis protein [Marichromatium purpuratum]AHF03570.1 cytochrome C biogenesis protein [Marichromatium purpuratum 984]